MDILHSGDLIKLNFILIFVTYRCPYHTFFTIKTHPFAQTDQSLKINRQGSDRTMSVLIIRT